MIVCSLQNSRKVSSRSGKQTSAREVKMAADVTFLVFCEPGRSLCVVYPGCNAVTGSHVLQQSQGRAFLDWWPPFFSTSISLVPLSGLSCTTVAFLQARCLSL